ncbi:MAG: ribonuclease HII [Dermatophilaceae bacterium]
MPPPRRAVVTSRKPSLRTERLLQREGYPVLAGMDEVGRGALAGPVTVGVVVIDEGCRSAPSGVKDSKLLTPAARERMVPRIERWCIAWGVGHAGPDEIDTVGIMGGLRLAGLRALAQLGTVPDLVILDGNHDWLTDPQEVGLLAFAADHDGSSTPPVRTMIKADLRCSSVAAASVLAKVARDRLVVERAVDHPGYGWLDNKGYAAPEHLDALRRLGPTEYHRRSWNIPGCDGGPGGGSADAVEDGIGQGA